MSIYRKAMRVIRKHSPFTAFVLRRIIPYRWLSPLDQIFRDSDVYDRADNTPTPRQIALLVDGVQIAHIPAAPPFDDTCAGCPSLVAFEQCPYWGVARILSSNHETYEKKRYPVWR